ncbi:hypothetical protein AB6A23_01160 [Paenibacillus tarimensis]
MKMTIDYAAGPNGNGNGIGKANCHVVPPGFIPPGLAKKCGYYDEEYPDMHPGGPRDGWEKSTRRSIGSCISPMT